MTYKQQHRIACVISGVLVLALIVIFASWPSDQLPWPAHTWPSNQDNNGDTRTAQQCADRFRTLSPEDQRQYRGSEAFIDECVNP